MNKTHYDVLIVGAGLSGIGAAAHLLKTQSWTLLPDSGNARGDGRALGICSAILAFAATATCTRWALISNPGKRKKRSRMARPFGNIFTKPPTSMGSTRTYTLWPQSRQRVLGQRYAAQWSVKVKIKGKKRQHQTLTCKWLHMCAGYYKYDQRLHARICRTRGFRRRHHSSATSGRRIMIIPARKLS